MRKNLIECFDPKYSVIHKKSNNITAITPDVTWKLPRWSVRLNEQKTTKILHSQCLSLFDFYLLMIRITSLLKKIVSK